MICSKLPETDTFHGLGNLFFTEAIMRRRKFLKHTAATFIGASILPNLSSLGSTKLPIDYPVDLFEMRIATNLIIPLVGISEERELLERIARLRVSLRESGYGMPKLRIRDSSCLDDGQYQVLIAGRSIVLRDLSEVIEKQGSILRCLRQVVISHQNKLTQDRAEPK